MKPPVLKGGQGRTEADLTNDLVAMCFGPAAIHPVKHLRPVLAFRPAGARIYFKETVIRICLSRQKRLQFLGSRLFLKPDKRLLRLCDDLGIVLGFAHFDQLYAVAEFLFECREILNGFFQMTAFTHNLLGPRLVVPQIRVLCFRVQFIKSPCCLNVVKDASSAVPATALSYRPKPAFPPA